MAMAAVATVAHLHLPCPEPPKLNPLALLSLTIPLASRMEAGSAVPVELGELGHAAMAALGKRGRRPYPVPVTPPSRVFCFVLASTQVNEPPAQPVNKQAAH